MKKFLKKIPILGPIAQKLHKAISGSQGPFPGSEQYWINRYESDESSGDGSYGKLAEFKAEVLNQLVLEENIQTVIEYGCGDGNQLKYAKYPSYTGYDISDKSVSACRDLFDNDSSKTFRLMNQYNGELAQLTLSLDVVYHLIEDDVFDEYMQRLFDSAERFVVVYSSNINDNSGKHGPHIRHRQFSDWIDELRPTWNLRQRIPNRYPFKGDTRTGSFADFFIYEKA